MENAVWNNYLVVFLHPSEKYATVKLGIIFPKFRDEHFEKYMPPPK